MNEENEGFGDFKVIPVAGMGPEGHEGNGVSVAYTSSAGTTVAIATGAEVIDVLCTTDAFIRIAAAPTAVANDYFVVANQTYRFPITSGNKVSAIQVSSAGTLYVHPVMSPMDR